MIVVSDASPVILLAKMDLLDILGRLFGGVAVPEAVMREIGERPPELARVKASGNLVSYEAVNSLAVQTLRTVLGAGESEAIVLAQETKADLLLTDDMRARRVAEGLGLKVTGTLGVIVTASEKGLIEDGLGAVTRLREEGLWLADEVFRSAVERLQRQ